MSKGIAALAVADKVRVVIATTNGPVEVSSLVEEAAGLVRSTGSVNVRNKARSFESKYSDFVDALVLRPYGKNHLRLIISKSIDGGSSW